MSTTPLEPSTLRATRLYLDTDNHRPPSETSTKRHPAPLARAWPLVANTSAHLQPYVSKGMPLAAQSSSYEMHPINGYSIFGYHRETPNLPARCPTLWWPTADTALDQSGDIALPQQLGMMPSAAHKPLNAFSFYYGRSDLETRPRLEQEWQSTV